MMVEVETVAMENGTVTPELQSTLAILQSKLEKVKLSEEAQKLLTQQKDANSPKENTDANQS